MDRGVYSQRKLPKVHLWKCPLKSSENLKKLPSQTKLARVKPKDLVTLKRGRLNLFRYITWGIGTYLGRGAGGRWYAPKSVTPGVSAWGHRSSISLSIKIRNVQHCHVSCVMCHVSCVMCHVSCVISSYHHIIISSYHHIIISSYHHIIISSYHHIII